VTKIAKLRQRAKAAFKEREGVNLTFLPFFAKATVEALKQHPNVNASYNEDTKEITYHGAVHLGIAVDTERGLLSVVIHDAGELSLRSHAGEGRQGLSVAAFAVCWSAVAQRLRDDRTMRVPIAGASGLIGSALGERRLGEGHEVRRLVRREARGGGEFRWAPP